MKTREEIRQAANEYIENVDFSDYVKSDAYDAFIAGVNWGNAHNPEITYFEHEIERLKSKLQAADDLNTLLTAELEKAKSPWISVEERLPEEEGKTKTSKVVFIKVERCLSTSAWYNFETKKWHLFIGSLSGYDDVIKYTITHWMPIPEV